MCVLFYSSIVCLLVDACDFKSTVHCGSALGLGGSGLPYYCAPLVCVPAVLEGLTVWLHNKPKTKNHLVLKSPTGAALLPTLLSF